MIDKLNLSSNPFRNRITPYLLSLLLIGLAGIACLFFLAKLNENSKLKAIAANQIRDTEAEIARLKGEGEKVSQQLSQNQRDVLVASHRLVANKSFGWSRLFADIESVLPGNVSASRIGVENVYKDGDRVKAELEFNVLSSDYTAVMSMIDRMNNSGLFRAELRGQNLQKNERLTYTEFTLNLIYTPAQGYASQPAGEVAQNNTGGAE